MALRYDPIHNRFRNVRYNTPSHVDYETLLQSRSDLLTIDENYEVTQLLKAKTKATAGGLGLSVLVQPLLGKVPAFVGLHGYSRALVRAAWLVLPWLVSSRYYAHQINKIMDSAIDRRLQEFYVNPISRQFVI